MAHLGERITEYLVGEMTASEAAEATEHMRQCSDCSRQVEELQRTLSLLQAVPDREPPRPLVFELEPRRQRRSWLWQWASPAMAAVAASIVTAMLMSPARVGQGPALNQSVLAAELDKRDQSYNKELLQLRSEIAYWQKQQQLASNETLETARSISLLARKLPSED